MTTLKHGSLFSGIGGFDLAAEWMGWENIFHCEWNEFGQQVLKYYWPKAISYYDITKTDFTIHRGRIDILTGGFPCQPYSMAGKRLGKEDERHLWPEMLRAIREIQPRWIVGENVHGIVNWSGGLVFEEVQADLETQGYEVQPIILPACGIDAPHKRERVWFVAFKNSNENGWRSEERKEESSFVQFGNTCTGDNERLRTNDAETRTIANTAKSGLQGKINRSSGRQGFTSHSRIDELTSNPTNAGFKGLQQRGENRISELNPTTYANYKRLQFKRKSQSWEGDDLVPTIHKAINQHGKTSQLNPRFVAEMMGFPPNWTELPFLSGETKV